MIYNIKFKNNHMNSVILDCATAITSIIILILGLAFLPALLPAAYATILAIILFIVFMSVGGYYISKNNV
ncbi:MAG: hypothetical protein PHP13_02580 [Methanomicrobium sp.]|nr:hypothetical protein [Methanomicrobium sp.]